ncbi:formate dehydrogenase accessory protein FdhE [Roseomonas sp. GC11]|uniref:formate dehydrogenase accessory protein FdhE n=1 Tax=Roseomonas sp. GC11 TaxID=2950546 RepID=UPI00210DEDEE|nr:formate dehydrogenase accessory protein FdhE [Roseomonas sp. GC11]MCQ4162597.1 formate dehydrogenase accessory protein FdhE [Roseomonas sp. GC11]
MSGFHGLQPDPSMIGRLVKPAFVLLPDPGPFFRLRAERLAVLAEGSELGPYLRFLAGLASAQAALAEALPPAAPPPAEQLQRAREHHMPPLDRAALAAGPELPGLVARFLDGLEAVEMPPPAAAALAQLRGTSEDQLKEMLGNVAVDAIPPDSLPEHLFLAAAFQVQVARHAAVLDAAALQPIEVGVCPVCGGAPIASAVVGRPGAENARYAHCSGCGSQWNEVRIKCLACGSTKGVGYQEAATEGQAGEGQEGGATVKAETCDSCGNWVKIFYQNKNPAIEPLADDVASLGLNLLMRGTKYRCAGYNPFLIGY